MEPLSVAGPAPPGVGRGGGAGGAGGGGSGLLRGGLLRGGRSRRLGPASTGSREQRKQKSCGEKGARTHDGELYLRKEDSRPCRRSHKARAVYSLRRGGGEKDCLNVPWTGRGTLLS